MTRRNPDDVSLSISVEDGEFFASDKSNEGNYIAGIYGSPAHVSEAITIETDTTGPFAEAASAVRRSRAKVVCYISGFEVEDGRRGLGIGSSILKQTLRHLKSVGASFCFLVATPDDPGMMEKLVSFYGRHGFRELRSSGWFGVPMVARIV